MKRTIGKEKPQMMIIVIAEPGRGINAVSKDAMNVIAEEWHTFTKEALAHHSAVRRSARKKMRWMNAQEPVVGLKYGKGYRLRCCPKSLMAA